jgi:hypothetical protein
MNLDIRSARAADGACSRSPVLLTEALEFCTSDSTFSGLLKAHGRQIPTLSTQGWLRALVSSGRHIHLSHTVLETTHATSKNQSPGRLEAGRGYSIRSLGHSQSWTP